jgi:hypothetical protein
MNLIKTIEEKVGIKKPEPYLKRLFDLNKGLIDHGGFYNAYRDCSNYIKTVMNYTNKEWNKTSAHRAKENRHHYREELPRYKQIGKMKALVEMMERGQFKYPVTFKDHNEREVYRSVATALYLEKVYKTNATLMYKIEPRYLEIRAKFSTGEWFAIDWEKMYKSCEFLTENRTVDIPLFTIKNHGTFLRIDRDEIDRENFEDQSKPHHIKTNSAFSKLQWISEHLHHLHISTEDPTQVTYYPTLTDYRKGREVRTKLGRYLTKYQTFFGLTEDEIKKISDTHLAMIRAKEGWKVDYRGSCDPKGWWDSYYDYTEVSSCMVNDYCEKGIKTYCHPKSDLKLYYLYQENFAKERMTIARAITRGDKYVRVYPDPNGTPEGQYLESWLESNGFEHDRGCLDGALLKAKPTDNGEFYIPYVDGEYQRADLTSVDYSEPTDFMYGNTIEYLQICCDGDYDLSVTCGHTGDDDEDEHGYCADCDSREHIDNLRYVEGQGDVCEYCIENEYIWVSCEEEYYHQDQVVHCESDSEYYPDNCLAEYNIYYDDDFGAFYHIDDMKVVQNYEGIVYHYHEEHCVHLFIPCSLGYEWAYYKDVIELPDGDIVHKNDLVVLGYI